MSCGAMGRVVNTVGDAGSVVHEARHSVHLHDIPSPLKSRGAKQMPSVRVGMGNHAGTSNLFLSQFLSQGYEMLCSACDVHIIPPEGNSQVGLTDRTLISLKRLSVADYFLWIVTYAVAVSCGKTWRTLS